MTKNIKFVITRFVFPNSKSTKIRFRPGRPGPRWGSLRRSPRLPSRQRRGIPPPHSPPGSTPSRLELGVRRLGSQAPLNTKSWLRHCCTVSYICRSRTAPVGSRIEDVSPIQAVANFLIAVQIFVTMVTRVCLSQT